MVSLWFSGAIFAINFDVIMVVTVVVVVGIIVAIVFVVVVSFLNMGVI